MLHEKVGKRGTEVDFFSSKLIEQILTRSRFGIPPPPLECTDHPSMYWIHIIQGEHVYEVNVLGHAFKVINMKGGGGGGGGEECHTWWGLGKIAHSTLQLETWILRNLDWNLRYCDIYTEIWASCRKCFT